MNPFRKPLIKLFFTAALCSISFFIGYYTNNYTVYSIVTRSRTISSSRQIDGQRLPCLDFNISAQSHTLQRPLDFEPHHSLASSLERPQSDQPFSFCSINFTFYCPCHDPIREEQFPVEKLFRKERHCPQNGEKLRCLIPRPVGYRRPYTWPKSKDYAWFCNVPFPKLTVFKKTQNWVRLEGDRLVFPGGGTSFPKGAEGYIDEIKRVVPLKSGTIRTALDIGCGVASFGASLIIYDILTMSIAPRDAHEAQVQFALERGLPSMLEVLGTYRLPYPTRSFDMAHCSRCLVNWTDYDGLNLIELDRVLRPGGYWILSGPPINWKENYKGWRRQAKDLEKEQKILEGVARRLCWKKIAERGQIAVWRKPTNHRHCIQKAKIWKSPQFCFGMDPDAGWKKEITPCITPLPDVKDIHAISGGALEKWPKRLYTIPPRIGGNMIEGITVKDFNEDNQLWKRRVSHYGKILKSLFSGKYRNVMDMNAGLGGFGAALVKYPLWVMNVLPFDAKNNTLGIIYERGLIGTCMNWCEAFSTYPRTYDMIHAHGIFSMYMDKCDILDILLEMYRIIRPEGTIIIRDHVDVIVKVKDIMSRMRWNGRISHSENGPLHPEKILLVDNSG